MGRSSIARSLWIQTLADARKASGLSQVELGAKVGLPQSHISRMESGAVDIRLSSLLEISRTLGLEPIAVPRSLVPAVRALVRAGSRHDAASERRPAYSLDQDDDE